MEIDDNELAKLISGLVHEVTDGGQNIEYRRFTSYQDEPVGSFEEIKQYITDLVASEIANIMYRLEKLDRYDPALEQDKYTDDSFPVMERYRRGVYVEYDDVLGAVNS